MRHYWYTGLLLLSLVFAVLWKGATQVYGKLSAPPEGQINETEQTVSWKENEADHSQTENSSEAFQPDISQNEETISAEETKTAASDANEPQPLFPENFQGVLFIGDSRTMGIYEYGDTGAADVFADRGMNVFDLWDSTVTVGDKGKKTLEQLLTENQYQAVHLMLGVNELGYTMDQIVSHYRDTVEQIRQLQPQSRIILGANMHVTAEKSAASDIYNNPNINELNGYIQQISQELGCYYIDINEKFDDSQGNLSAEFSTDGFHILGKYYSDWVQWLKEQMSPAF